MEYKPNYNLVIHLASLIITHLVLYFLGLRMLDQPFMTDLIEANAMGHMPNEIDIYSASWGPTDDGKTVDGPRNMTMRAIVKGVNEVEVAIFRQLFNFYIIYAMKSLFFGGGWIS